MQGVNVRRFKPGMSLASQLPGPLVIGQDQDDIRPAPAQLTGLNPCRRQATQNNH